MTRHAGRRFLRDEGGVSVVLGAVLVMGIFAMVAVVVQTQYVPVWEEAADAEHLDTTLHELATLAAHSASTLQNGTASALAPVTLAPPASTPWGTRTTLPGTLTYQASTSSMTLSTARLVSAYKDGTSLAGLSETWTSVSSNGTIAGVGAVDHLRIRITDPEGGSDGDSVTLTILDSEGAFAGDFRISKEEFPSGYKMAIRVRDADSNVLYDDGESRFAQDQPAYFWANVLEPALLFDQVLQAASKPALLSLSQSGYSGQYTVAYTDHATQAPGGNAGVEKLNYDDTFASGSVFYDGRPKRLLDQDLVVEFGGVVAVQDAGSVVVAAPPVQVRHGGGVTVIDMTLPRYQGDDGLSAAGSQVQVGLTPQGGTSLTAQAPHLLLNLTTSYPAAWMTWWSDTLDTAGLDAGAAEYTVTTGTNWCRISLYGSQAAPSGTTLDTAIRLTTGSVNIQMGP